MSITKQKITKTGILIVFLGALFYFYEYFLRISPAVMQPELTKTFALDAATFGTLSAFYFYAYTPMQLLVGIIVDRVNLRLILTLSVLCCAVGSLLIASTDSYSVAVTGRFLQGFGSAFAFVGSLKLAVMWLPAERFAFFSSLCTSLGFWGAALGEIMLTAMVKAEGWRASIIDFTVIGFVLAVAFWFALKIKPSKVLNKKVRKISWSEMLHQLKDAVKKPRIWYAGVLSSLIYMPTTVFAALWGIPYLEATHKYTPGQAALATSMIFIGWALGAPIQGWVSDYFRNRVKVIMVGSLLAGIISIFVLFMTSLSLPAVCTLFVLFGITSSVQVLTFAMARDVCSPQIAGTAIAFVNMLAMVTGMILQGGIGEILDWSWDMGGRMIEHGSRIYTATDYEHAMIIIPVFLFLSAFLAIFAKVHKKGLKV